MIKDFIIILLLLFHNLLKSSIYLFNMQTYGVLTKEKSFIYAHFVFGMSYFFLSIYLT